MTSLYLCYQSLLDPLTQTQVVAYLEGLAKGGYRIVLLTFEPRPLTRAETCEWRSRLKALGIDWHWRRYHKRPTVPATLYDVLVGIVVGWWLIREYGVRLVHARAHVPGLMAYALKFLTRVRFLFDVRGFMAEEYVDAGVWPAGGILFRATKGAERMLVQAADGVIVLTEKAKSIFRDWYGDELRGKPFAVIPCCMDFRRLSGSSNTGTDRYPETLPVIAYVGKLGGKYMTDEMVDFVRVAAQSLPGLRWKVWTQSDPTPLVDAAKQAGIEDRIDLGYLPPKALSEALLEVDIGLAMTKPCFSAINSSLTKVGEYLASGVFVVATAGTGDTDEILGNPVGQVGPVGTLIRDFTADGYHSVMNRLRENVADRQLRSRCRGTARSYYHLEEVGWSHYRKMYSELLDSK